MACVHTFVTYVWSDVETKRTSICAHAGSRVTLTFLLVILVQNGLLTQNEILIWNNEIYVSIHIRHKHK